MLERKLPKKKQKEILTPVLFLTDIIVRLTPKHGLERVEVARDCLCQGKRYLAYTDS